MDDGDRIAWLTNAVRSVTTGDDSVSLDAPGEHDSPDELIRAIGSLIGRLQATLAEGQRLREVLRETEDRYRRLRANIPGMVYSATVNRDGSHHFLHASSASRELFDLDPGELMRDGSLLSSLIHPDDQARRDASIQQSAETLQPWRQELRHIVNGEVRWHDCMSRPERDPEGRIVWDGIILEITERKRSEAALRESETKYRRLHQSMSEAFCRVDMSGILLETNPAYRTLVGYSEEELKRLTYRDLTPKSWHDLDAIAQEQVLARGYSEVYEKEYRKKDGTIIPIELRAFLIRDDAGQPVEMWAIVRDITERVKAHEERRRLEAQVLQAQKLESLGVLAGGIAHDFNNLLTAILGNADLALRDLPPLSDVRPAVEDVALAARRGSELCRQMLAYSGRGRFVIEAVDLSALVKDMANILEVSVSKMARLEYQLPPDLPAIRADASQIRQVVMNLIINASEAIGDRSGRVTVRTGCVACDREHLGRLQFSEGLPEGRYVFLEVNDTGCGMDAQTSARIFDPFFTTKFAGRGLGLAAVLGIVRGHQGAIQVHSQPGKGTTFQLLFPASAVLAVPAGKEADGVEVWRGAGYVLLVDDEAAIRSIGKRMLERLGFSVLLAEDGEEALEVYETRRSEIRCVLLDLTMPKMGGNEAYRRLRDLDPDVRVILSSGFSKENVMTLCAAQGPTGFVQKPYNLRDMAEAFRQTLQFPVATSA